MASDNYIDTVDHRNSVGLSGDCVKGAEKSGTHGERVDKQCQLDVFPVSNDKERV